LAAYTAILYVRVPAFRAPSLLRAQQMARDPEYLGLTDPQHFLAELRRLGFAGTAAEAEARRNLWIEDVREGRVGIRVPPEASLMVLDTAFDKVRPLLIKRRWELLRVDGWPGLVIGDQPVTLRSSQGLAGAVGFANPGVQVMLPLSPQMALLISDAPRERLLEVKPQLTGQSLREPWWAVLNRIAWLTSSRYVFAQRRGHLEATELLVQPDDRRRDIRVLDTATEASVMEKIRERSRSRRRASSGPSESGGMG
jgi:hypothetical protein